MARKKYTHLLAMWDMKGLECIFDISLYKKKVKQYEKELAWSILKDDGSKPTKPEGPPLSMMLLRARYNSQRQYEIYEFTSEVSLTDVKGMFNETPQTIVNWIRKNGYRIYSDYSPENTRFIK